MSLPPEFLANLGFILSQDEIASFIESITMERPSSIRTNPFKNCWLEKSGKIPWCANGYYLPERKKFTFDPLFHAGTYYVQEAGSMLIEQALKQLVDLNQPIRVLDLCASPGGKTTHLLSLISKDSVLVSNEVIGSRIPALEQNVIKWGTSNCIVTQNDPEVFEDFGQQFDVIVIDAPCSGEGMFRKHDHAITEWSLENVNLCSARQQRILENVWPALKENGLILYSTCTYNLAENENNIAQFLENHPGESLRLQMPDSWNVKENKFHGVHGYRMMPHLAQSEGFFLSVIKKIEDADTDHKVKNQLKPKDLLDWKKLVKEPDQFTGLEFNNFQFLFPTAQLDFLAACKRELYVRYCGTEVGEVKGNDFIPSQALALCNHLNLSAFRQTELSLDQAIKYLQKGTVLSSSGEKGIELVTFQNCPLGFIKNLGSRSNNLYPKNWRILSSYGS